MSNPVIRVKNISKRYRIGVRNAANTFAEQFADTLLSPLKNLKRISRMSKFEEADDPSVFWALKDINFEVKQGDVIGIIGKNGAGKSTLLKILSRITEPTTGEIEIKGRVSALLEVGTGFHPELTGRDNIYMNGTILGMTKKEIDSKFEEIIDFAGIEKHLDTPVKFYSSGMSVRLGFSVAAHLEPEILIIDEVLAVGDSDFQKKCLGKMNQVSKDGRTVLFVSHNMTAVRSLCSSSIWLKNGNLFENGNTDSIIDRYLYDHTNDNKMLSFDCSKDEKYRSEFIQFKKISIQASVDKVTVNDEFSINFEFENLGGPASIHISLLIYTMDDLCVFNTGTKAINAEKGILNASCHIPANFLNDNYYKARILIIKNRNIGYIDIQNAITFQVHEIEREIGWYGKHYGIVRPNLKWNFNQTSRL